MCVCVAVSPPVQVVVCGSLDELHQVVYVYLCSGLSPCSGRGLWLPG